MSGRCSLAPCGEGAPGPEIRVSESAVSFIEIKEIDRGVVPSMQMSSLDGYLALRIGDGDLNDLFRPFQVLCRTGEGGVRAEDASLSASPTMFSSKIGV
jgi:hypothetical protein